MKRLSSIVSLFILLTIVPLTVAADCPALVKQALAATDSLCKATENNQACYGNLRLQAKPNSQTKDFIFSQPGDHVNVSDIKSLQLSPMTLDTDEWGVALMHIQANLPSRQPANLTLLAFGDVTLENDVALPTPLEVSVVGRSVINVRLLPSPNAAVVGTLKPTQTITAVERLEDGSWLRVQLPDSGQTGWVKSDYLSSAGDLRTLNIVDGSQPHYSPMQAFTFKSGSEAQGCAEVPQDGLIIQTPEGSGEVQLWINHVVVKLGSTVYFQARPSGDMVVTTVEGHATVEAMGVTYTAVAGSSIHIKLDADMHPVEPPTMPQAYQMASVANLPIENLPRKMSIHEPLTTQAVASVQQSQTAPDCVDNSCYNGTDNTNENNNSVTEPSNGNKPPKDDKPKDDKKP